MKKNVLLSYILLFFALVSNAQNNSSSYKTAIGVKFYPTGLTVKSFIGANTALEGIGYFWEDGTRITGLYEIYGRINGANGLSWYIGPGAHIGFWNTKWKNKYPERDNGVTIGLDGVLGLDYKLRGAPIDVSLDWQPSFTFVGYNYFEAGWGGLGIRYTF